MRTVVCPGPPLIVQCGYCGVGLACPPAGVSPAVLAASILLFTAMHEYADGTPTRELWDGFAATLQHRLKR